MPIQISAPGGTWRARRECPLGFSDPGHDEEPEPPRSNAYAARVAEVDVPDLVGMVVADAVEVGRERGVVVTSSSLDGPPLAELTWPGVWLVESQVPSAGSAVTRGSVVQITFVRGGGDAAGDREPRLPSPDPGHLVAEADLGE
jgi:hypothetical protein